MRVIRYIATLMLGTLSLCAWSQDFARMGERTINGSARYVGMAGAMTAIGGDPSAALDNPACGGLYQRMEAMIALGGTFDRTHQVESDITKRRNSFICPQVSLVVSFPSFSFNPDGVQYNNMLFSYRRMHSFNRTFDAVGGSTESLGAMLADVDLGIAFNQDRYNTGHGLYLYERGYVDEYAFQWSMNIAHKWYVGAGFQIQSYLLSADADYIEEFDAYTPEGRAYYNRNVTSLLLSGAGCTLSAGLIYRPLQWLRIGFGINTPSLGALNTYTTGTFSAQSDSLRYSYAPNLEDRDNSFHMPLHTSTSVAFQIGAYGMIGLQYDYLQAKKEDALHSLRLGLEVIPVMGFYLNAGYAYESTFKPATKLVPMVESFDRQDTYFLHTRWTQYASIAAGYRGKYVIAQAAYQYRWQRLNLYAYEKATPYDIQADTHRIVVTIAWHQY